MELRIVKNSIIPIFALAICMVWIAGFQLGCLTKVPGDLCDSRFNQYLLENIYKYLQGGSESLINLGFFYPYRYVLGFSDNLFGSAPAYLLFRLISGDPERAFQIWFLCAYVVNYLACYVALRKLDCSQSGSTMGALIFSFGLPVTESVCHSQMLYRFGIPMCVSTFLCFLEKKNWNYLLETFAWFVWQLYCGIYTGFFLMILVFSIFIVYLAKVFFGNQNMISTELLVWRNKLISLPKSNRFLCMLGFFLLLGLIAFLFYPYLEVTRLYHFKRDWVEISKFLPRWQSYLISDSYLWNWISKKSCFDSVPRRDEQHLFPGLLPLSLAAIGYLYGRNKNKNVNLMTWAILIVVSATISIHGHSAWRILCNFPFFSAIRGVCRVVTTLLFPVAFLSAIAVDGMVLLKKWRSALLVSLLSIQIIESASANIFTTDLPEWKNRLKEKEKQLPQDLPESAVLFFAQNPQVDPYIEQVDAMWVSLNHGLKTLNGYSGWMPPGFLWDYGNDPSEFPRRINAYLYFSHQANDDNAYAKIAKNVIPIGFKDYPREWLSKSPVTFAKNDPTPSSVKDVSLAFQGCVNTTFQGREKKRLQTRFMIKIMNKGSFKVPSQNLSGNSIRVAWRLLNNSGNPISEWDVSKKLPLDLLPHEFLDVEIVTDKSQIDNSDTMEIKLMPKHSVWDVVDEGQLLKIKL